ncbi:Calcium homeostasis endoplasmic reticulum protein [Oopsacas minuta]|uniref:Calcium homeostasis endoplasmic reticulum protein n=1 Tax=Oopsacas minuta TaxID=111878 RepID=A0AAV7JPV2_9METZ|nr:Calcium homeostasis endoplasmic reticulum protein [Oopsacas minuta]
MDVNLQRQPEDTDVRTLIDGFAKFVAKNGLEFENLTKEKHKGNPQFSFLFGGLNYQYYQQKLNEARMPQRSDQESSLEQISPQQPQDPLVNEFEQVIKPVIAQCTKDSISAGKSWILSHFQTQDECIRVSQLLLGKTKCLPGMNFYNRLHVVYLINDVLHHCIRKNNQNLRRALQQQIPHMFSNCSKGATPDNLKKLTKLVKIWRSQNYFEEGILVSLDFILAQRESELANIPVASDKEPSQQHSLPMNPFPPPQPTDPSLINIQRPPMHQHPPPHNIMPSPGPPAPPYPSGGDGPERHLMPQQGFGNPNQFNYFSQQPRFRPPPPMHPGYEMQRHPNHPIEGMQSWSHRPPFPFNPHDQYNPGPHLRPPGPPEIERYEHPNRFERPPHPGDSRYSDLNLEANDYPYIHQEPEQMCPGPRDPHRFSHPHHAPPPSHAPAYSERFPMPFQADTPPPSHFEQDMEAPPPETGDTFNIQYYDLPAGLMAPLVPLAEHSYTPLDPSLIRLPPPQQPSQRLLNAVDNFYSPPTEENPRNKKGWEAKALIDFFEAKRMAILGKSPFERIGVTGGVEGFQRFAPGNEKDKNYTESSHSSGNSPSGSRSHTPSSLSQESSHSSYTGSPPDSPIKDITDTTSDAYPTRERKPDKDGMGRELGFSSYSFHQSTRADDSELIDDKYAGVGLELRSSDIYEQYRRTKSYTYNRRPPPTKKSGYKGRK